MKKKLTAQSAPARRSLREGGFFSPRVLLAAVVCSAAACSMLSGARLAFFRPEAPAKASHPAGAGLTFAERVAYQRASEEVYSRHQIWPKENSKPKPSLDEVMSAQQIEKNVEDYLRDAQALEDYWQRPITPDQLQAEMERIATHTKQPGVLRELFAALGNDPMVIAECLARPVLAERLITELYAHDHRFHGALKQRAEAELRSHRSVRQMKQTSGMYTEIEWIKTDSANDGSAPDDAKSVPALKMNGSEWQDRVEELAKDFGFGVRRHVAAFESADMSAHSKNAADEYETLPIGKVSPLQEDDAHYYAVTVMKKGKDRLKLATIAWLKEPLQSWVTRAETQVQMTLVAVSANYTLPLISSPSVACTDDTWTPTSLTNVPAARSLHTAVWTGSEMIVWGGIDQFGYSRSGGRYNPTSDTWLGTSFTNAPSARWGHTAVWTGSEMIVWGGYSIPGGDVNTGGRYNPTTDSWTATTTTNAPDGRDRHTAVWTGSEMIVWGGTQNNGITQLNTGGRYNVGTDSWTATTVINAPNARFLHTGIWSGNEMIVWGGVDENLFYLDTGGRYSPGTGSWTVTSITNAPSERGAHTAIWTGNEMIVWGGYPRVVTGGRYNPGTDTWTATSTTNAPPGRDYHTAVWTGSEMIVWGGQDDSGNNLNTGGRYCAQFAGPTPTPTPTPTATPTPTPTPGQITLSARSYKVQGQQTVDLSWNGATSNNIDIYRNGALIATVPNIPGFYTDHIGVRGKGTYTYRVCDAGTQHCSNQVTVRFGGGG